MVVLSRGPVTDPPPGGVYRFAATVEEALACARRLAAGKDVTVMGGGATGGRFLCAGLLDALKVHVVPVVLGRGTPLLGGVVAEPVALRQVALMQGYGATHLRFVVQRHAGRD